MTGPVMKVGAAALCVLVLTACRRPAPQAFERPPAPVSVVTAIARDVPVYLDEIGTCVARETVAIQPQVSGRVTRIHFEDGADLKAGDLLFTIDPRPYQALVAAAEATLAQQKTMLDWDRVEFGRMERLIGTKAVAQADYDSKQNIVRVAEAQVLQGEAALETARINLEYCTIRSPIDGRAGRRLVDIGNVVNAAGGIAVGGSTLLVIQRLDPIYADFTVTENELTSVQRHMAKGTLKVEVRLPEETGEALGGELTFIDNAVQEGTGTVKLRATVPNPQRRLWPGRFVRARLVLETLPGAVLIPAAATQVSAKGTFVYVVKEDSTAEMRPVRTGQRQEDLLVVEEGVKGGERVVVSGQMGVTPGGKVRVEEAPAAAVPPPSPALAKTAGAGGTR